MFEGGDTDGEVAQGRSADGKIQTEGGKQDESAQTGAEAGSQRVPSIDSRKPCPHVLPGGNQELCEHRKRGAHGRGGRQKDEKRSEKDNGVESGSGGATSSRPEINRLNQIE